MGCAAQQNAHLGLREFCSELGDGIGVELIWVESDHACLLYTSDAADEG